MSFVYLFFFIFSVSSMQFCSYSSQDVGFLEKVEHQLWSNPEQKPLPVYENHRENVEEEPQFDAIDCQTKIINCCCLTLSLTPLALCITSFFVK